MSARVAAHEALFGTVLTIPGVSAAELMAEPFDVVWIDLEHAALGPRDAQEMLIGAQAAGVAALVRLPADAHGLMAMMLDAGADGIVLASVDDARVAANAVLATRHPPHGRRGYGPRRAGTRGRSKALPAPTVWAQIETRAGVVAAGEIVRVNGIDAVIVGTADLSFAVGTPLETASDLMLSAVASIRDAARSNRTAFGLAGALLDAPAALRAGAQILIHSTDARLCAAAVDTASVALRTSYVGLEAEVSRS